MGQQLSRIRGALITRPAQRFNIEARTEKLLNQEKTKPAPKYEADKQLLEQIQKERPEITEAATKKDDDLLKRLEQVYVASTDPQIQLEQKMPENPNRPLPGKGVRNTVKGGFLEAYKMLAKPTPGKLNIGNIEDILSRPNHQNSKDICAENSVSSEKYAKLVANYSVFTFQPKWTAQEVAEQEDEDLPYLPKKGWENVNDSKYVQQPLPGKTTDPTKQLPSSR